MEFLDKEHQLRYNDLFKVTRKSESSWEYKALFYILSAFNSIYYKLSRVYDIKKNQIVFDETTGEYDNVINSIDGVFSSSEQALIRLAFNLFNGYTDKLTNPRDIFQYGTEVRLVAMNAIFIRFNTSLLYNLSK